MAIRLIDAIDSMRFGGYIDVIQDQYIPPKWFSDLCEANNSGFSAKEYDAFERNPARYVKPPVVHSIALCGITAMQMGITEDQLRALGMDKEEYWVRFYTRQTGDNEHNCYEPTDIEENIIRSIKDYFFSIKRYNEFMRKDSDVLCEIVIEWMHEHGISIVE